MLRKATFLFLAVTLTTISPALAGQFSNHFTLLNRDLTNGYSYIMPSIAPAGADNEFYVTYLQATDYHVPLFAGVGNIYGGKMAITADAATWVEEPVQLNGDDNTVKIGFGGLAAWTNFMKPARRGDTVAWSQFNNQGVHYYDFADGLTGSENQIPTQDGRWARQVNPRVTENGAIAYWARSASTEPAPGPLHGLFQPWTMRVYDTGLNRAIELQQPTNGWNWDLFATFSRLGDVVSQESGAGRVAFSKFTHDQDNQQFGFQVYSSEYEFGAAADGSGDAFNEPVPINGVPADHVPGIISSIKTSGDYLVWQRAWGLGDNHKIQVAQWNGAESRYDYVGELPEMARAQEPGLFGSYLVYAHREFDQNGPLGTSIKMVNLADGVDAAPELLVEVDPDYDVQWPAAWVDQDTGDYVVLYQQMASPASLMVVTSLVPEPGTFALFLIGGLGVLLIGLRRLRK